MSEGRARRWIGEFLVIVLGVLVALAVDDVRQYWEDRSLERHLLQRMSGDLSADGADLALAQLSAARRIWVLQELLTQGGSSVGRVARADLLPDAARADSMIAFAGRTLAAWDSINDPLSRFVAIPEFDLSDDSYQEMLATGSFATIDDFELRAQIMSYYRVAADYRANARWAADHHLRLEEAWASVGIAVGDVIALSALRPLVQDESVQVELRSAHARTLMMVRFFRTIAETRDRLDLTLRGAAF